MFKMLLQLLTAIQTDSIIVNDPHSSHWTYADQSNWGKIYPSCRGHAQSPIDIQSNQLTIDPKLDEAFKWSSNFHSPIEKTICRNSGQTYSCHLVVDSGNERTIEGGGLIKTPLKLAQLHLHFGSAESLHGSEHRVDGKQFPGEIHFVFRTMADKKNDSRRDFGSLAVWAFFIDIDDRLHRNGGLGRIFEAVSTLRHYDDEASLENETMINLGEIMPINFPDRMTNFFRYAGSLTTPGCFETVQWTVFRDPLFITTSQYMQLLEGSNWAPETNMVNTFRLPQAMNGRKVTLTSEAAETCMFQTAVSQNLACLQATWRFTAFMLAAILLLVK